MRGTDDGLRVVSLAVVDQPIGTGAVEAILTEKIVLAYFVVLRDRSEDCLTRYLPQPHD